MERTRKYFTILLTGLLIIVFVITVCLGVNSYRDARKYFFYNKDSLFSLSVRDLINKKIKKEYFYISVENDPKNKKIGSYVEKVFRTKDTTFIYKEKVVDYETCLFRAGLTYFLHNKKFHAKELKSNFDSICKANHIYVRSAVSITEDGVFLFHDTVDDSAKDKYDYKTSLKKQGLFEDITLTGYLKCSYFTYWNLMLHTDIIIGTVLIILFLFLLFIQRKKVRGRKNMSIEFLEDGKYRINHTIIYPAKYSYYTIEGDHGIISEQLLRLLQLFLQNPNYEVTKQIIIKEFWPKYCTNPTSNVTSIINRLNNKFNEMKNGFIIINENKKGIYKMQKKEV